MYHSDTFWLLDVFIFPVSLINFLLLSLDVYEIQSFCRGWERTKKDSTYNGINKGLTFNCFYLYLFILYAKVSLVHKVSYRSLVRA